MEQKSTLIIEVNAKNAEKNTQRLIIELRNLQNNSDRVSTSLSQTERQASQTSNAFKSLATQMAGIVTVGAAISKADEYTQMAARIKNATESMAEYEMVQDRMLDTAQNTYRSLKEAQEVYLATAGGLKELNYSTSQAIDISDSLSYSFVHNATTAEKAMTAMNAFGKIMDKGKVTAIDWFSMMVAVPNVLNDIADATGKTTAEIRKMGAEGDLSVEMLTEGLRKGLERNKELATSMSSSLADGLQNLSTAVTVYLGELNMATDATNTMAMGLNKLGENIDLVAKAGAVVGLGLLTKTIIAQGIAIKANIDATIAARAAKLADLQATATATAAEASRTGAIANLTRWQLEDAKATMARMSGMQRLSYQQNVVAVAEAKHTAAVAAHTVALNADTAAQNANNLATSRGAMIKSALGGTTGLVTLAVMAAATAYFTLSGNVDKSTKSLMENNGSVDDAIAKYKELNQVQQANQIIEEQKELKKLTEERESALQALRDEVIQSKSNIGVTSLSREEIKKLYTEYKTGKLTLEQLTNSVRTNTSIVEKDKNKLIEKAAALDKAEKKYTEQNKLVKIFNDLLGNTADEATNATRAVNKLTEATEKYNGELAKRAYRAKYQQVLEQKHGFSKELSGAYADLQEAAGGAGARIDANSKINAKAAVENEKSLERFRKQQEDAIKAQEDADKKRLKAQEDANKKSEQLRKEAAQRTIDIQYELSSELDQMYADLEKKGQQIMLSDMSSTQKNNYLRLASEKYNAAVDLINFENEYARNEHNYTEETKLRMSYNVQEQRIIDATVFNKKLRELELTALRERFDIELAELKHNQASRLLEAQKTFIKEAEYNERKYELEVSGYRNMVDKKMAIDLEQAAAQRKLVEESRKFYEKYEEVDANYNSMVSDMNPMSEIDRLKVQLEERQRITQEAYDIGRIQSEEYHDRMLEIESNYRLSSDNLRLSMFQSTIGGWADMFKNLYGEQSTAYRNMFMLERAFAITKALLNVKKSYSDAYAAVVGTPVVGPYIAPAVGAAAAALQVAQATQLRSINMNGFETGGYTGNGGRKQVAGVVHGQEYVLNAEATNRIGRGTLDAINSGRDVALGSNQPVIAETNVVLVDEREKLGDYLYTPDGKRSMIKFIQQHADEIGI